MPGAATTSARGGRRRAETLLPTALLLVTALVAACSGRVETPRVTPRADAAERVPVVLVPGISGSALRDRASGEIRWGRGPEVIGPKDGGYSLALPIPSAEATGGRDPALEAVGLEAISVIDTLSIFGGLVKKPVYGPVLRTLEANGWTRGDLDAPSAGADLYAFAYDWRQDNLKTVSELLERLRALAASHRVGRPDEPFIVDLICQSNGAHLCRYLMKYGDASLDEAEAGRARPPAGLHFRKVVLVGTSNGGSLRILREVHRGRRYVPVIGRKIQPETLFTMPAILQDLPGYTPHPFVDERGRRLDVDLFDAETWRLYGFSVFTDEVRARMARRPDLFGSEVERFAYLQRNLDRGRRLHSLLARDVPRDVAPFDTAYYLLQNGYDPSPELAVLRRAATAGGHELLFTGDDELEDDEFLHYLVSSPGDGHATYDSQRALSRQEVDAIAAPPFLVRGGHFELILDPATLRRMVDFLRMPLQEVSERDP